MLSLSLTTEPTVPSIFSTKPTQDYVTGQYYSGRAFPVFNDSIENRQKSFDHGFFIYVQVGTYHELANMVDDTWFRLQCACERIFAMTHSPEEWVAIMGKHYISDLDWYDRFSPESDSEKVVSGEKGNGISERHHKKEVRNQDSAVNGI